MKVLAKLVVLEIVVSVWAVSWAAAQGASTTASAQQVTPAAARPSPLQIQQNFVQMERSAVRRDLEVALRCIQNARRDLRNPDGTINKRASIDLLNCTKRAEAIQRLLDRVARRAGRLGEEAEAEAEALRKFLQQVTSEQGFPD
jgi:hypothetical protein